MIPKAEKLLAPCFSLGLCGVISCGKDFRCEDLLSQNPRLQVSAKCDISARILSRVRLPNRIRLLVASPWGALHISAGNCKKMMDILHRVCHCQGRESSYELRSPIFRLRILQAFVPAAKENHGIHRFQPSSTKCSHVCCREARCNYGRRHQTIRLRRAAAQNGTNPQHRRIQRSRP